MRNANTKVILLVEDDAASRELFRSILKIAGYTVVPVADGVTALQYLDGGCPDAIVLDMALPRLHGRDVFREVQANPATRTIPIIVVTGDDVTALGDLQYVPVLRKPVEPDDLLRVVDNCLRGIPN